MTTPNEPDGQRTGSDPAGGHGDRIADLPLRPDRARELVEAGMAREHRFTPAGSGWVTIDLRTGADTERVIELMRESYERVVAKRPELAKQP